MKQFTNPSKKMENIGKPDIRKLLNDSLFPEFMNEKKRKP